MPIPFVSYAPSRGRTFIDASSSDKVNQSIEQLRPFLVSFGWISRGIKATTEVFVSVCPVATEPPTVRIGVFDNILFLEGMTYAFYDPHIDTPPSGSTVIPVTKQASVLASMAKLAGSISAFSSYIATVVDDQHLRFEAKVAGTGANNLPCNGNGSLSAASPAKGGGYSLFSGLANGVTQFSVDLTEGQFANLMILIRLNGHETPFPLGKISYEVLADPYQLAIYPPDDDADYRAYGDIYQSNTGVFVCAPFVPEQHRLAYCAFAIFGTGSMRKTTSTTRSVAIALNGFYCAGDWRVGDSGFALNLIRLPGAPLLDPKGRSILQEALISLSPQRDGPGDAGATVLVGRVWDAVAESRWNPRGAETLLDDHRWVLLMSDDGGGDTQSSLWIACD